MNSFFNDCVEDLLVYKQCQTSQMKIKYNSNTMCIYRVIENKLNDVVRKLKGKLFMFIFNVSIIQGIFPELMKMAKIR